MTTHATSLESRLFRRYWDDGLLDLLAGIGVAGIGVFWTLDLVAVGAAVPAMLAALWGPLRRRFIEPRLGLVEFSDERDRHSRHLALGGIALGAGVLAVFAAIWLAAPEAPDLLRLLAPGLPAFLLALLAAVSGLALGLPRFLTYAAVLSAAGFIVAALDAEPGAAMIGAGGLIALWGSRLISRLPPAEPDPREVD